MNLLALLPTILRTVAKVTGLGIADDAAKAIEGSQLPPEKQVELQEALLKHEEAMAQISLDDFKTAMSESLAEIQSPDKFVSRARPFGVYIACLITTALAVAMIAGVKLDTGAIVTLIAPCWGQAAWYSYNRTQEKLARYNSGNAK